LTVTDSSSGLTATQRRIIVHAAGASLIPVVTHRDLVFDPQRDMLYITTSSGTIERYDLGSGDLLTPFQMLDRSTAVISRLTATLCMRPMAAQPDPRLY